MRRLLKQEVEEYVDKLREKVVQEDNKTIIGGNLDVNGQIRVNEFSEFVSKKGEQHYMLVLNGQIGDDVEIIDATATYAFIKLIITNIDTMATYEYVYNDDDGLRLVNSSGDASSFTLQTIGGILTLKAGYSQPTKVIANIDIMPVV